MLQATKGRRHDLKENFNNKIIVVGNFLTFIGG